MLTAAVRDLVRAGGDISAIDVRTSVPEIWENNPHISRLPDSGVEVEVFDCEYPAIHQSNRSPAHFISAFHSFLSDKLKMEVKLTDFCGDVHLGDDERESEFSATKPLGGESYWIVSAGGKTDFTIKWWDVRRFQDVVDHFRGRLAFVHVGAAGFHHPELKNVLDLRGRTSIRELIQLVYHSAGVLTPVSFLMHLAAAVEPNSALRIRGYDSRPCVVVAGGREPPQWEAYPTHQFIHTVGALKCCSTGGCWRSRTFPLYDGTDHDSERRLCVDVVNDLPRCMDMITADDVIRRIEYYLERDNAKAESHDENGDWRRGETFRMRSNWGSDPLTAENARKIMEEQVAQLTTYPSERFSGRGVVICAGGEKYTACAWVCIQMLRRAKCTLPVQIWYLGDEEFPLLTQELFKPLGVEFVDGTRMRRRFPARRLDGWELKAYAMVHSRFEEILLLDADNVPLTDPEYLFETPQFSRFGAIFWPDIGRLADDRSIWRLCGIAYRDEPEFESGQILVRKEKCWEALNLALWMNEHSDFFYEHIHGDKETFHMAFRKLNQEYAMVETPVKLLKATMCQHDFNGRRIFQHRNLDKWSLDGSHPVVSGFEMDLECRAFLDDFRQKVRGERPTDSVKTAKKVQATPSKKTNHKTRDHQCPRRLVLRAPINGYTGYGLHSQQVVTDFRSFGYEVAVRPTFFEESLVSISKEEKSLFVDQIQSEKWELLLTPPHLDPTVGKKTAYFTMWETTKLPPQSVPKLNAADCVIVPCKWNVSTFRNSGVKIPIHLVPLGIKADVFRKSPISTSGPCIFGAAGRLGSDPRRKCLDEIINHFLDAFPIEKDVRLWIKISSDGSLRETNDPRIVIFPEYMTEIQLAKWFRSITCFVSTSRAEGWGLMQQQAMATGRPLISTSYGGVAEFFSSPGGYVIPYKLVPADGQFHGFGEWAQPDRDAIIESLRMVRRNPDEARTKGEAASSLVSQLTWIHSNKSLANVLKKIGALKDI